MKDLTIVAIAESTENVYYVKLTFCSKSQQ